MGQADSIDLMRGYRHTCVTSLSAKGHQGVLVQLACLVIVDLEDGSTAHGRFGGGDDGEVLACDS